MSEQEPHFEAEIRALRARLTALQQENALLRQRLMGESGQGEESPWRIIDAVPGLIAYIDRTQRYRFVNATYEAWFGLSRAQIVNRSIAELVTPEMYEQVRPYLERVLTGERVTFESTLTYPATDHKTVQATYEPHRTPDGQVDGFYVLVTDISERKRAELAAQLLAEAGKVLAGSLDYTERLASVAKLIVPHLADWCAVSLIEGESVRNVAVAHVDPAKVALASELQRRYPPRPDELARRDQPWQHGQSELYPEISDALLEAGARDAEHYQILRDLRLHSAMTVPLIAHDRVLGVILFVWAESGKRYDKRDLALAEELARRAAIAIENAHVYEAEQQARAIAEKASDQLRLLAAASNLLITAADYEGVLIDLAHLMVPTLADWCVVDVLRQEDGRIHRLAVAHHDPAKADLAARLQSTYPTIDPQGQHTVAKTLRHSQAWFDPAVSPDRLAAEARDAAHLELLQALGFASEMVVPLIAHGRTLGTLTLVRTTADRSYQAVDLTLAEELARRIALAVDNARLYRQAKQTNAELEARVVDRTAALQAINRRLEQEIAEHRRTQAELTELQRRLVAGREAERLFLAQELHDGPVQDLYAVMFQLAAATPAADQTLLQSTTDLVQKAIRELRTMANDLRPPTLTEFGLQKTIISHLDRFQKAQPDLRIQANLMPDEKMLPEAIRLALFRIYQAALANVIRHAAADTVSIQLRLDAEQVTLTIEDNGCGFELPPRWIELARQGHLGLVGMVERAEAVAGQISVHSTPGQGTIIEVTVPLPPD